MKPKSAATAMMRGMTRLKIFHILLYISGSSITCFAKTVIYDTGEPKIIQEKSHAKQNNETESSIVSRHQQGTNNLTNIKTDHFLVSISKNKMNQSLPVVKEVNSSVNFIKIGDALLHDDENDDDNDQVGKGSVPESVQDTLRKALIAEIVEKLKENNADNLGIKSIASNTEQLYAMKEIVPRKREVTDMFVKFLEDLSKRLNLDVVTVAEQLISRSSERNEIMEMTAGYARNIIPSTPVLFKPIIKLISKIVNKEIRSARLLA